MNIKSYIIVSCFLVGCSTSNNGSETDLGEDAGSIDCHSLDPASCRANFSNGPTEYGPCFVEVLDPYDREKDCYNGGAQEICVPFDGEGNNSERIIFRDNGECFNGPGGIDLPPDYSYVDGTSDCACIDEKGTVTVTACSGPLVACD